MPLERQKCLRSQMNFVPTWKEEVGIVTHMSVLPFSSVWKLLANNMRMQVLCGGSSSSATRRKISVRRIVLRTFDWTEGSPWERRRRGRRDALVDMESAISWLNFWVHADALEFSDNLALIINCNKFKRPQREFVPGTMNLCHTGYSSLIDLMGSRKGELNE